MNCQICGRDQLRDFCKDCEWRESFDREVKRKEQINEPTEYVYYCEDSDQFLFVYNNDYLVRTASWAKGKKFYYIGVL